MLAQVLLLHLELIPEDESKMATEQLFQLVNKAPAMQTARKIQERKIHQSSTAEYKCDTDIIHL
jgi:hypothetical protein